MRQVLGTENPAVLMTNILAKPFLDKCRGRRGQKRVDARAHSSIVIQGKEKPASAGRLA